MKLISFNVNDASIDPQGIEDFIQSHKNTDIWCFQEAFKNMQKMASKSFPNYITCIKYKYVTDPDTFSNATYINPKYKIIKKETLFEDRQDLGLGTYCHFADDQGQEFHIINYHGMSRPVEKLDCENRLDSSKYIIDFMNKISGTKIIAGDFNLLLDTESVKIFEKACYRNLIKNYKIKSTRNEIVFRKFPNNKLYYSDYIFISPDLRVKSFEVPYNEISDHLPMILEV